MYKHSPIDMSRREPVSQMQERPLSETAEDAAVVGASTFSPNQTIPAGTVTGTATERPGLATTNGFFSDRTTAFFVLAF
jgi:hypothetical protein